MTQIFVVLQPARRQYILNFINFSLLIDHVFYSTCSFSAGWEYTEVILANFENPLKLCFPYYVALGHKTLNISTWKLKGELICYFLHLTDVRSFHRPLWFIILKLQNGCSWCSVKVAKRIAYSCAWIVLKKPNILWFYLFPSRCSLVAWANHDFFCLKHNVCKRVFRIDGLYKTVKL